MDYDNIAIFSGDPQILRDRGNEGWEACYFVPSRTYSQTTIELRRPRHNSAQRWEHKFFSLRGTPDPAFANHLESCGWQLVNGKYEPTVDMVRLYKREEKWMGTDDGDVIERLRDLNAYSSDSQRNWWKEEGLSAISEILAIKWNESCNEGRNIGTYEAVKRWIDRRLTPKN